MEGIRPRHSRRCRTMNGGTCTCRPSWEAFVYLRRDGKKMRETFPTRAAAKAWRADALNSARRGRLRAPSSMTLEQASDELLDGMKSGSIPTRSGSAYKPSAIRSYERALNKRILPALGHMKLSDIQRADVQHVADELTKQGLSASAVANSLDPLRKICRRAIRRDLVAVNPCDDLELRRPRGKRDRIAPPAEAKALLAALPDEERCLWATGFYAGLRRGELRALRWSDIKLDAGTFRVEREWDDEEGELDEGKSKAAARTVPILEPLASELRAHLLRTGRRGDDLVFGRTANEAFVCSTVRRRALKAWEAQDPPLKPITPHEARHTCASTFIESGANPKQIMEIMGHASIQMTYDIYGHLFPDSLEQAAAAANAYLATA